MAADKPKPFISRSTGAVKPHVPPAQASPTASASTASTFEPFVRRVRPPGSAVAPGVGLHGLQPFLRRAGSADAAGTQSSPATSLSSPAGGLRTQSLGQGRQASPRAAGSSTGSSSAAHGSSAPAEPGRAPAAGSGRAPESQRGVAQILPPLSPTLRRSPGADGARPAPLRSEGARGPAPGQRPAASAAAPAGRKPEEAGRELDSRSPTVASSFSATPATTPAAAAAAAAAAASGPAGSDAAGRSPSLPTPARGPQPAVLSPELVSAMRSAAVASAELLEYVQRLGVMDDEAAPEFAALFEQFLVRRHVHAQFKAGRTTVVDGVGAASSPELIDWSKVRAPVAAQADDAAVARARSGSHGADVTDGPADSAAGGGPGAMLRRRASLLRCPADGALRQDLLRKVAVVKLNGGLGSRMGCWGPKSTLEVREGLTFLDLAARQVEWLNATYNADVPLVLMNSFQTHDDTVRVLGRYATHDITVHCVLQSCFPRLDEATMLPIPTAPFCPADRALWYPPGHGDVWRTLSRSGVLAELLSEGREWLFVSNVDNLGATVDLRILHALAAGELDREGIDFAMEVTPKTKQDRQGGVLVEYGGRPMLAETAQAPEHMRASLESLRTFRMHNTNNLWASARRVQELVEAGELQPPVMVDRREVEGIRAVQLETTAGAAIASFRRAVGIEVGRSRFLPVKSTSDLLAIQSNLFDVRHGALLVSGARQVASPPVVRLGPEFTRLRDYAVRFAAGLPDMVELDHLTVSGDVLFGRDVKLRGTVIIVANEGSRIDIPDGAVLENKVVTGNLRILDN